MYIFFPQKLLESRIIFISKVKYWTQTSAALKSNFSVLI